MSEQPDAPELTNEEIDRALKKYLDDLGRGVCPYCGKSTEPKEQIGRCVYGACGCRLYQGKLPKGGKS